MIVQRSRARLFLRTGFILLLFFSVKPAYAQENFAFNPWQIDTIIVVPQQISSIDLPERHRVMQQSILITKNGLLLEPEVAFKFNSSLNRFEFFLPLQVGDSLSISYNIQPILLKRSYSFFKIDTIKSGTVVHDSVKYTVPAFQNPFAGFSGNLKRSGSIVRGVNIGSNKDLTINSGLNLQLSGYLTEEVEVVAALTDESTPIQPEGNTLALREVDKVYIKFKSPWLQGSLGDFNLQYSGSQFADLSKKLQGVSLQGNYENYGLGATVASTRGFFNFISFLGQEGNQGAYQLVGKNGEQDIVVLAGTERVWVNGEQMVRGEINDYTIEYALGQITFTNKRMITSESRIEIDFEYYPATQKYTRNVYSGTASWRIIKDKFKMSAKYYNENDDPEKVLEEEGILTQGEKDIIQQAGDDPYTAYISGATEVGDSLGSYIAIDTTFNDQSYTLYKYVGLDKGNFRVSFSSVGKERGDYVRDRLGVYRWVGIGKGGYLPIKLLPLPSKQQLADIQAQYTPSENFYIESEYAISNSDRNILSGINDDDNAGNALRVASVLRSTPISVANTYLGKFAVTAEGRLIDNKFQGIDRFRKPDFNRYWNILRETEITNEEKSLDTKVSYLPWEWLKLQGNLGILNRKSLDSFRYSSQIDINKRDWFRANLQQEYVSGKQKTLSNDWLRQIIAVEKDIGYFQPGISYKREQRKNNSQGEISGFEYNDWGAGVALINSNYLTGKIQYNQRRDEIFDPAVEGRKIPQSTTSTSAFRLNLSEWNRISGHLEITFRQKKYTSFFKNIRVDSINLGYIDPAYQDTVWQDRETNLAELVLNNYQWKHAFNIRWQYRISTEQLALREKIYIDVGERRGNYRFDEDLREYVPDPDGDFVLFILQTGKFEPSTNIQTSVRLTLDPRRVWKQPKNQLQKLFTLINSQSYFRIEEVTQEDDLTDLYLLNLSKFQGSNTRKGSIIFNEDLYLARQNRNLSFRLRYRYRDDLFNQFLDANDNEDRLSIERSMRADYRIVRKIKGQTELGQKFIYRFTKGESLRNRDIRSAIVSQNISYRPNINWELGMEAEMGFERDVAQKKNLYLRYDKLLMRVTYALLRKGRITADYEHQTVKVLDNPTAASIPFEMARGKKEGVNQRWQLRGEYTVTENVVISLLYRGRDEPAFDQIIHSGQAEVRAYF
jgi:hypothetical protein